MFRSVDHHHCISCRGFDGYEKIKRCWLHITKSLHVLQVVDDSMLAFICYRVFIPGQPDINPYKSLYSIRDANILSLMKIHVLLHCSNVDDIVLGYIVDVLSNLGEEDSSFDVDQFSEMIPAYVPEFAEVDRYVGCPVNALLLIDWLYCSNC